MFITFLNSTLQRKMFLEKIRKIIDREAEAQKNFLIKFTTEILELVNTRFTY